MAGYEVVEAAGMEQAMEKLEERSIDLVAVALDLPMGGGPALLASIRNRSEWNGIPAIALVDSAEQIQPSRDLTTGFEDYQTKYDGSLILESVARLVSAQASVELEVACVGERE